MAKGLHRWLRQEASAVEERAPVVPGDVTSDANRLPVNDKVTTWAEPVRRLHRQPTALDIVAIDNLSSLLPRESSAAFSADLTPYLGRLPDDPVWARCRARFEQAVAGLGD